MTQLDRHVRDYRRTRLQTPPMLSETASWYCALTSHGRQVRASLELYDLGFRTFMPKIRRWVSHARRVTPREYPLLGQYLFVEADPDRLGAVVLARSVETLLTCLGEDRWGNTVPKPVEFASHVVEDLRMRHMAGEWDEVAKGPLPVGARIRIIEGEFANMLATVTNRKGQRIDFKLFDSTQYGRLQQCSVRAE